MGGRESGELASKLCVDTLRKQFHYFCPSLPEDPNWDEVKRSIKMLTVLIKEWMQRINGEIYDLGRQESHSNNMGTTVVMLHIRHGFAVAAHVGDSRIYRIREGEGQQQVTEDHSFINRQLRRNLMTPEEARHSKQKNIVTRALGTRDTVETDVQVIQVREGDIFLLCSDGLTDLVDNDEIEEIILNNVEDLEHATNTLIDLANARGGKDNITTVLCQVFDLD